MSGRRFLPIALAAGAFAGTLSTAVTDAPASPDTATATATSLSGAAAPGSDATIVATSFTVAKGQTGSNVATCPDGERVVGGGIGHPNPPGVQPNDASGVVLASGPVDETGSPGQTRTGDVAHSWLAAVTGGTWRVYAICSATSDATIQQAAFGKVSDGSGSFARGSTTCPAGTRVVGGGVNSLGPLSGSDQGLLGPNVITSEPLDQTGLTAGTESGTVARSWAAAIILNGANESLRFQVLALCSAGSDATIESKRFTVEVCVGCGTGTLAACPPGKRALGGGIGLIGSGFGNLFQSQPVDETGEAITTDSGDAPRSWSAFVNIFSTGGDSVEYRVSAICGTEAAAPAPKPAPTARCAGLKATIVGTAGPNTLRGTPRADVIAGLGGNDTISGLGGNDVVCGGAGNDTITGGPGNDRLAGEAGNDSLDGGPGNDSLVGGPGLDRLAGGPGVNTVRP
jgi:Ca2+-binding RTX toxin-like protein